MGKTPVMHSWDFSYMKLYNVCCTSLTAYYIKNTESDNWPVRSFMHESLTEYRKPIPRVHSTLLDESNSITLKDN